MTLSTVQDYYPLPSEEQLKHLYIGRSLGDDAVPAPAAVIDVAIATQNCSLMLDAVHKLGVQWRAHVKTHKTTQLTRLQVGEVKDVRLIVSTVVEAENLVPYLLERKQLGKSINVLYGLPLPPSQAQRLGEIGSQLGSRSVAFMIDDAGQLPAVEKFQAYTSFPAQIFVKIDTGYHRAGIDASNPAGSNKLKHLLQSIRTAKSELIGFYSHSGHSYHQHNELDALETLIDEITGAEFALQLAVVEFPSKRFTLSVGATPSTTSVQNLLSPTDLQSQAAERWQQCLDMIHKYGQLELHAGVYPLLDEQQLATHARPEHSPENPSQSLLSHKDIAGTVLAEVCSLYNDRSPPEALIAAGSLALGREPCPSYRGWGVVTNWGMEGVDENELNPSGLIIDRISQEHGILAREHRGGKMARTLNLRVGQKVRIWPNHACIALAGYGWYLIVDSSKENKNEIVDVWVRWRGW